MPGGQLLQALNDQVCRWKINRTQHQLTAWVKEIHLPCMPVGRLGAALQKVQKSV